MRKHPKITPTPAAEPAVEEERAERPPFPETIIRPLAVNVERVQAPDGVNVTLAHFITPAHIYTIVLEGDQADGVSQALAPVPESKIIVPSFNVPADLEKR